MSLLLPHSSHDKAADCTTCLGQEDGACICMHKFMCVCHPTQDGHLLIVRSEVGKAHFCTQTATLLRHDLSHSLSLACLHTPSHTLTTLSSQTHTHASTHAHNQVWLSEQATQWEWVIRPSESGSDLSLHIKSSAHVCFYESVSISSRACATSHQMSPT